MFLSMVMFIPENVINILEYIQVLLSVLQMMGNAVDWSVVKDFVPGRNIVQCRERFVNTVKSLNFVGTTFRGQFMTLNT